MKYAVISMDIEDWYHLEYFSRNSCDRTYSMLDGLNNYLKIIESHQVPSSFFVLGELVQPLKKILRGLCNQGYDIGAHGWSHKLSLAMCVKTFKREAERAKNELEDVLGVAVKGYRAPCFNLDRERLDIINNINYKYDSSRILFGNHPLYSDIDLSGFDNYSSEIFCQDDFFEFQVSTLNFGGMHLPVSGGGYLRIIPWMINKRLLNRYLSDHDLFVFYIHPFELSSKPNPPFPSQATLKNRIRLSLGRSSVAHKMELLIRMLKKNGFKFITFSSLREKLINGNA